MRATRAAQRNFVAWSGAGILLAVAITLDVSAVPPNALPEASSDAQHRAFRAVASEEAFMRRGAVKGFPADPWSQDDDFHNREIQRVRAIAGAERVSVSSMLRAVDDGARDRWDRMTDDPLVETVPPCRPRPIY
jgi:hypothetical protein